MQAIQEAAVLPIKQRRPDKDVLGVGLKKTRAAQENAVPPNKMKEVDGNVLDMGAKIHTTDRRMTEMSSVCGQMPMSKTRLPSPQTKSGQLASHMK